MKLHFTALILAGILFTACDQNTSQTGIRKQAIEEIKDFDYGHMDKNVYVNSFFDFELALPKEWSVQNREQMNQLTEAGNKIVVGDNKNLKAAVDAAKVNTASLLMAYKYELGTPVESNPGVFIVAENTANFPGIKDGSDYLYQARRAMKSTQVDYLHIDETFEKAVLDHVLFYKMNSEIEVMGKRGYQTYYCGVSNGFCLLFCISYTNDDERAEGEAILQTLKFKD